MNVEKLRNHRLAKPVFLTVVLLLVLTVVGQAGAFWRDGLTMNGTIVPAEEKCLVPEQNQTVPREVYVGTDNPIIVEQPNKPDENPEDVILPGTGQQPAGDGEGDNPATQPAEGSLPESQVPPATGGEGDAPVLPPGDPVPDTGAESSLPPAAEGPVIVNDTPAQADGSLISDGETAPDSEAKREAGH